MGAKNLRNSSRVVISKNFKRSVYRDTMVIGGDMADDKALEILKGARNAEEKIIPIYTKHLESAIFWTGIPEDRVLKAKVILKRLATESATHKIAVEALIARLERR